MCGSEACGNVNALLRLWCSFWPDGSSAPLLPNRSCRRTGCVVLTRSPLRDRHGARHPRVLLASRATPLPSLAQPFCSESSVRRRPSTSASRAAVPFRSSSRRPASSAARSASRCAQHTSPRSRSAAGETGDATRHGEGTRAHLRAAGLEVGDRAGVDVAAHAVLEALLLPLDLLGERAVVGLGRDLAPLVDLERCAAAPV